jgi:hypothetical protein
VRAKENLDILSATGKRGRKSPWFVCKKAMIKEKIKNEKMEDFL